MQSRIINTSSDNETPEQTYLKAFENRRQIIDAIKALDAQTPFIRGMSTEQLQIWEAKYHNYKNELIALDLGLNDWLTYYPHLAQHNSLNSILPAAQPSRTQTNNSSMTYANSRSTLFSIEMPDFHPGISTKTSFEKSAHRSSVKTRR
jgi:hypothetical protein